MLAHGKKPYKSMTYGDCSIFGGFLSRGGAAGQKLGFFYQ